MSQIKESKMTRNEFKGTRYNNHVYKFKISQLMFTYKN